jgi:hypothetical protein
LWIAVTQNKFFQEIIPTTETSAMIAGPANREHPMNRTTFLRTASSIRNGRIRTEGTAARTMTVQAIAGFAHEFEICAAKLAPTERTILLSSLLPMLERERRKCKARAGRYDAGRHISLYMAVKSLMKMDK